MSKIKPLEIIQLSANRIAKIFYDELPDSSPREVGNLGVMVCFHRRYSLGDKHKFADPQALINFLADKENVPVQIPLFFSIHSGATTRTSNPEYLSNDRWIAGQIGFIFATREAILKEYGKKRLSQGILIQAQETLEKEVREYDQFIRGEVYRYVIEDAQGVVVDSSEGYYDLDNLKISLRHDACATAKKATGRQ